MLEKTNFTDLSSEEQTQQHYNSALDSVNLINDLIKQKPDYMNEEQRADMIKRNSQHLEIVVKREEFTKEQNKVLSDCVQASNEFLNK